MGKLLRNRRIVCRRPDRIAVRRSDAHRRKAASTRGGGWRRLFDAERVHFAVVLLLSAVLSAPWHAIGNVAVFWGLVGLGGIVYSVVVARRMRVQTVYRPVFEDWLFHVLFPLVAYALLAVSAYVARSNARPALFLVGAATLLLLFVGIHNAWDAITYHLFKNPTSGNQKR